MAKKTFDQVWKSITGTPGADLSTKQYTFVTFNTDGDVVTPAAGAKTVGVLYEPNKVGQPAQVVSSGFAFITLGAAVTAGQAVMTDANGDMIPYAEGVSPAINYVAGICQVGGATGDIGTILLG